MRVLSFNAWLLKPLGISIAQDVNARAAIIPHAIAALNVDIVALQEVWGRPLREKVVRDFAAVGFPYSGWTKASLLPRLQTRILGNGLLVFSKEPIASLSTLVFKQATAKEEHWVAKGALRVEIVPKAARPIAFYNVHLGAVGFDLANDRYRLGPVQLRSEQFKELVAWIAATRSDMDLMVCGDLNLHSKAYGRGGFGNEDALEYRWLVDSLRLRDASREKAGPVKVHTFDQASNGYAQLGHFRDLPSETIDYVFVGKESQLRILDYRLTFIDRAEYVPIANTLGVAPPPALSDHYGVLVTVEQS